MTEMMKVPSMNQTVRSASSCREDTFYFFPRSGSATTPEVFPEGFLLPDSAKRFSKLIFLVAGEAGEIPDVVFIGPRWLSRRLLSQEYICGNTVRNYISYIVILPGQAPQVLRGNPESVADAPEDGRAGLPAVPGLNLPQVNRGDPAGERSQVFLS
jgi:hypothetical protein